MQQEFETQILNIDKDDIIKKLRHLGAIEESEVLQRRWVYDIVEGECLAPDSHNPGD